MPENSFDSIQIRVSNLSGIKGGVKIEYCKWFNTKYVNDLHVNTLYTVDTFLVKM